MATQYLVTVPSGATWGVYEQNLDVDRNHLRPGDDVWLEWDSGHAFGVAGRRGGRPRPCRGCRRDASSRWPRRDRRRRARRGRRQRTTRRPPQARGRKRSLHGIPAAHPGGLWLVVFFVFPLVQLFTVSLQSGFPGSRATTTAT